MNHGLGFEGLYSLLIYLQKRGTRAGALFQTRFFFLTSSKDLTVPQAN